MKLTVLLLFGGESSEHEVSLTSAQNVYQALDPKKYEVKLGYITKNGQEWLLVNSFDDLSGSSMQPILGQGVFETPDGKIKIDVIFPVLHGAHGEDGDVQGLARLMHIPCVGPSVVGAAMTMDKDVTKRLLRERKIPVVEWVVWHRSVPMPPYEDIVARLGEVLFVKPNSAGSSVGVSKVRNQTEYEEALERASEYDALVMIERAVNAREIEVAVLGNDASILVSTPGEIIPGEEFYSYDDKYDEKSTSQALIPADIPHELAEMIKHSAAMAYIVTRGQGMARVDFFVDKDTGEVYLNEINAIPGFTSISMYPKLFAHDGVSYGELVDRLIELAQDV